MYPFLLFALGTAEPVVAAVDSRVDPDAPEIVVTAALTPIARDVSSASIAVIEAARIDALGEPLIVDLLRLTPGVSVATAGPAGSQTQLRIRGAEANHTLLLVDGIRFNDPASGNEARFELLSDDGVRGIEVVRGPQSALYGAEAIGGVVAVSTISRVAGARVLATAETGGKGFRRLSGAGGFSGADGAFGIYGGHQKSDGIDSLAEGRGDRDGYGNLTFGGSARLGDVDRFSLAATGRFTEATNAYDGLDPATFVRANTLDSTRNRIGAGRVSGRYGDPAGRLHVEAGASLLASTNRNRLDGMPLNSTDGRRTVVDALISGGFRTGSIAHRLAVAADHEQERFVARDQNYGSGTNQRRTRSRTAAVAELRCSLGDRVTTDIAVRHDRFQGFRNATTLRGAFVARVAGPLSVFASYGQGIARPTFFDLFGFFPGSFRGNPDIRPERSRGGEVGVRYDNGAFDLGVAVYRQRLRDEIVEVFETVSSTANAVGASRRRGLEMDAAWAPSPAFRLTANYAYLDADAPNVAGTAQVKEVRRPRHSGSVAIDARLGALTAGASLAYVGSRIDSDFASFPPPRVRLGDYLLGGARVAYRIAPAVELFGRVTNLFDADYQDVVGYATSGRTVHGGIRIRYGD